MNILKKRLKTDCLVLCGWGIFIFSYHNISTVLSARQIELRLWVQDWYHVILWLFPVIMIEVLILQVRNYFVSQSRKARSGLMVAGSIFYSLIAFIFLVMQFIGYSFNRDSETTMKDGNLRIGRTDAGYVVDVDYAEPVTVFARKCFTWDPKRYAESLSKIYDTEFIYVGDDSGYPTFYSDDYPNIYPKVYGIDDEIDEDLRYLVTSSRLQEEWETYFTHGEDLVRYVPEKYYGTESERSPVYALVVYRDKQGETSEDIAAFIKGECESAKRPDGKGLYDNLNGSIYLLFKDEPDGEILSTRNIPYGKKTQSWIYDAAVTAEDILFDISREFEFTH